MKTCIDSPKADWRQVVRYRSERKLWIVKADQFRGPLSAKYKVVNGEYRFTYRQMAELQSLYNFKPL